MHYAHAMQLLDDSTIQAFARDGAVVLRGVLTPTEVAQLACGIEHNLAHLSPLALVASQASTEQTAPLLLSYAADAAVFPLLASEFNSVVRTSVLVP